MIWSIERVTLIKAQVASDDKVVDLEEQLMNMYAYRKMLETMQDNLERYYNLTSRELTRRTSANRNRF